MRFGRMFMVADAGAVLLAANTTIRSRLLGKSLIPRFPSPLPPLTVLDCILDANWRDNGIIHVLDVVRWKGQDIGDCEAPFRSDPPSIFEGLAINELVV